MSDDQEGRDAPTGLQGRLGAAAAAVIDRMTAGAREWAADEDLKAAMQRSGVVSAPVVHFIG